MTSHLDRLAAIIKARTNAGHWHLSSYRDPDYCDESILSVDVAGNKASWQDLACGEALGSCANELLAVAEAAKACAFYYGGDTHSGPARMAVESVAALDARLAAALPGSEP